MIIRIIEDDVIRTYSDRGVYIHGGCPEGDYEEAIDPVSTNRVYVETDIPVQGALLTAEETLNILLGGTGDEPYGSESLP